MSKKSSQNSGTMFSFRSLSGKFSLFLILIGFIVIAFCVVIVFSNRQVKRGVLELETIREPLADSLMRMDRLLDNQLSSVHSRIYRKIPQNEETKASVWENLQSHVSLIQTHKKVFSKAKQSLIDSLEIKTIRFEELDSKLNSWVKDNYVSAVADSTFLAELPGREQSEFFPVVEKFEKQCNELHALIDDLALDNETQINAIIHNLRENATSSSWVGLIAGLLFLCIILFGAVYIVRNFKKSIELPISVLQKLVRGETSEYVKPTRDEMGAMIEATNKLNSNLQQASAFAQSIGEGNVNFQFQPVSEQDMLGNSLVQMRDRLKTINEEDKKRGWVSEGLTKFADIMRSNDDYMELTNTIIKELVKYTESSIGGLFIFDETGNDLNLASCYAYERKKYLEKRIEIGMGLVGQCFLERRTIFLKEIPQGYLTITSGLGGSKPKCLLLVPLLVNEQIEGVLELASFNEYHEHEIEFVEKVGEVIASTIINVRVNERTKKLLEDSQIQSEQMRAQEEEMRQNMEEMQATQEQMQRQADETRIIQKNLELEKVMFHALMDYLPDRVTYKDLDSVVTRVNKAKAARYNLTPEEMIGTTDFDFFDKEHAENALAEEKKLIKEGKPIVNEQNRIVLPQTGEVSWASVSRIPLTNAMNQFVGMFIIAKDTTELNLAKSSLADRERIIHQLLENMQVFRYTISIAGTVENIWKSRALKDVDPINLAHRNVQDVFPNVYDLIKQEGLGDIDLVCKEVMEVNQEEKEIFKHHLFRDSAIDGGFVCFAIRQ